MKTIRSKITLTYILLAVGVIVGVGVISSVKIESYFKSLLIDELSTEADMVLVSVSQMSGKSLDEIDRFVRALATRSNVRITLIDSAGVVLLDSDVPLDRLAQVDNHLQRPEIQEAKRLRRGSDIRHSVVVAKDFLYVAKAIPNDHPLILGRHSEFIRLAIPLERVQVVIREIRFNILLAGLFVLLLVFFASALISRRISKPLTEIAERVEEIRAGNLDTHIEVTSQDEIGRLAQTVNELVDKLKADVVQLRKLEQVRSEFLGNVSHELRTPIFSLQGFLETLLDGAIDDPSVSRDFLEKSYAHATGLNTLLNDLIEISRIESGEMKMSFRYFQLKEFLHSVVNELRPTAERRQVSLNLETLHPEVEILGDKEKLRQALNNLIENATKYNKRGGSVTVRYSDENDRVRVSVSDTGIGIPQEHLPRIFERFYRIDKERSREAGGTGLGLAIVKHIVEAHGSKVDVTSEVGEGTSFSFTLKK